MAYASPADVNTSKGFGEVLNYINEITNSWASTLLLLGIFVIILIGYYKARDDFVAGFAVAGFGTFVIGLLFWAGGFVSGGILGISIAVLLVGVLWLLVDKNQ